MLFYFTSLRSNLYIPQCVLGTLPHLVVPSVRFDGYESYDRAFSRLQSGMSPTSWSPLCILHAKEVDNVKVDIEVRSTHIDSHKAKLSPIGEVPTREKLSYDEVLWMRTSTSTCGHILSLCVFMTWTNSTVNLRAVVLSHGLSNFCEIIGTSPEFADSTGSDSQQCFVAVD